MVAKCASALRYRKNTYVVFKKFIATPDNLSVLNPVDGKNIVTLQTCTLPDYTNRLLE